MAALRHLPQRIRWVIAAALLLSLIHVAGAQFSGSKGPADDLFSAVFVVPESDSDDSGNTPSTDHGFAAWPTYAISLPSRPASSFSTAHYLSAAYLVSFIIAPSRAPPRLRSI
jgi:hypothetical protein